MVCTSTWPAKTIVTTHECLREHKRCRDTIVVYLCSFYTEKVYCWLYVLVGMFVLYLIVCMSETCMCVCVCAHLVHVHTCCMDLLVIYSLQQN